MVSLFLEIVDAMLSKKSLDGAYMNALAEMNKRVVRYFFDLIIDIDFFFFKVKTKMQVFCTVLHTADDAIFIE